MLVHHLSVDQERSHASSHQRSSFNNSANGNTDEHNDGGPFTQHFDGKQALGELSDGWQKESSMNWRTKSLASSRNKARRNPRQCQKRLVPGERGTDLPCLLLPDAIGALITSPSNR